MMYLWINLIFLLIKNAHDHEKVQKYQKFWKFLKKNFFMKKKFFSWKKFFHENYFFSWKKIIFDQNFQIFELRGSRWVQKWCYCPIILTGNVFFKNATKIKMSRHLIGRWPREHTHAQHAQTDAFTCTHAYVHTHAQAHTCTYIYFKK